VCEPNDLLSYRANKGETLTADHPLLKLRNTDADTDLNWSQTLATIPFKQLKELTKSFKKNE
jgi:hypothetical protein